MSGADDAPLRVRDRRKPGWAWFERAVLDRYGATIGPDGIAVYMVLAAYANNDEQSSFPSYQTIADKIGRSRRQVIRTIAHLEQLGLIAKAPRYDAGAEPSSNLYILLELRPGGDTQSLGSDTQSPQVVTTSHQVVTDSHPNKTQVTRPNDRDSGRGRAAPTAPPLPMYEVFGLADFTTATATVRGVERIDLAEQHARLLDAYRSEQRAAPGTWPALQADARQWARREVSHLAKERNTTAHGTQPTTGTKLGAKLTGIAGRLAAT